MKIIEITIKILTVNSVKIAILLSLFVNSFYFDLESSISRSKILNSEFLSSELLNSESTWSFQRARVHAFVYSEGSQLSLANQLLSFRKVAL